MVSLQAKTKKRHLIFFRLNILINHIFSNSFGFSWKMAKIFKQLVWLVLTRAEIFCSSAQAGSIHPYMIKVGCSRFHSYQTRQLGLHQCFLTKLPKKINKQQFLLQFYQKKEIVQLGLLKLSNYIMGNCNFFLFLRLTVPHPASY